MINRRYVVECDWCSSEELIHAENWDEAADSARGNRWLVSRRGSFCSDRCKRKELEQRKMEKSRR